VLIAPAPLYVFHSDMKAQVNMQCCYWWLGEGDRGNNPAYTKSSELIRRNVPASWRIHKKSRSSQRSTGKPRELIAHV